MIVVKEILSKGSSSKMCDCSLLVVEVTRVIYSDS